MADGRATPDRVENVEVIVDRADLAAMQTAAAETAGYSGIVMAEFVRYVMREFARKAGTQS